jgi:hypothetical protein
VRARAAERAAALSEELAAAELARLVPPDALFYAELDRPGEQLSKLLDHLGLLGEARRIGEQRLAISPLLIDALLGLRGAAVAVTRLDEDGEPRGVVLLDPGNHEGLRGLIDTLLPASGERAEPLAGFPVWSLDDGQGYACLTHRLVIASDDRAEIERAVERLAGRGQGSLSDDPRYAAATSGHGPGFLSFYLNAEPLEPLLRAKLHEQSQGDPGAAMALGMLDIESLESLSGRMGVDDTGLGFELALELAEGHRNVVFNLLRRPTLEAETLELVPEGAAFFLATAMNPESDVAPIQRDAADRPVVSALDLGRELFGNVVDVALYGMPEAPAGSPLPDVSLVLRVNDEERSRALWDLGLGMLCQATGAAEPTTEVVGGAEVTTFAVQGVTLHLTAHRERLVLTTSRASIERALGQAGRAVKHDPVLGKSLAVLEKSPTFLLAACPGRIARMARPFVPPEEAAGLEPIAAVMAETAVLLSAQHSNTHFALHARVEQIPDISGLVGRAIERQRAVLVGHSADRLAQVSGSAAAAEVPRVHHAKASGSAGDLQALRVRFDELVARGDRAAAVGLAQRMVASTDDAEGLDELARALLEDERYAKAYDGVARTLALRANELSGHAQWRQLDTLALAEFRSGNLDQALRLAEQAVELAAGRGELEPELEDALELYRLTAGASLAGTR